MKIARILLVLFLAAIPRLAVAQTALPSNAVSLCNPTIPFPADGCVKPIGGAMPVTPVSGAVFPVGDGVVTGGATAATVVAAGTSGFTVGCQITLADSGSTHGVLTVATLSGSTVATVTIATAGVVSAVPSNPVSAASNNCSGVGTPTFTMTYAPIAQTLFSGTVPANGWKVNNPNLSGDLWASDNGVTPTANGASSYRIFSGGGGQYSTELGEKPPGSPLQLLGTTIGQFFIARRW